MSFRSFSAALWAVSSLLMVCIVASYAYYQDLSQLPLIGNMLGRPHLLDQATPILILTLFGWVLLEIAQKQRQVRLQHQGILLFQTKISEAGSSEEQTRVHSLNEPRALRRAKLVVECSRRNPSSLHEAVPAAAALDANTLAAGYGPLTVYAWMLPVLGFIGTASGMASAIEGFKEALAGGQVQVDSLAAKLSQSVIPGLSAAFETTILALAATLVVYLCTSALRDWDQEALDQLDRVCIVLLSRIPQPTGPDGERIHLALENISLQLSKVLDFPATVERAANLINTTAESFFSAANEFGLSVATIRATADTISTSADELSSARSEMAVAATTMREAAGNLKSKSDNPDEEMNSMNRTFGELASAIKDLQQAASAPIHLTLSRDTRT